MTRVPHILLLSMMVASAEIRGQEAGTVWRGNFIASTRGLMMSPCRSGERLIVEDATPAQVLERTYREITQRPGRAIFVELAGRRTADTVRAQRLLRAYAEGPGCREDLGNVRLRAHGTEPFWHIDVRRDAVLLRRPGPEPVVPFPAARLEPQGEGFALEAASRRSVLRLVVREAVCRDAMTGGYYALSASFAQDGRTLTGCAYWGDFERPR